MSERVLARLFLRLMGLYLVCQYIPSVLSQAGTVIAIFAGGLSATGTFGWAAAPYLIWAVTALLGVALGLNLLFWGNWAIALCTRGLSGCCFECGYDLAGHNRDACPECGTPLLSSQRTQPDAAPRPPLGQ